MWFHFSWFLFALYGRTATRCQRLGTHNLTNLCLTTKRYADWLTRMILHYEHQVALDRFQAWCDIIAQCRQYLFLDDTLLQFLYLLKDILAKFHSHFARVLYDAV